VGVYVTAHRNDAGRFGGDGVEQFHKFTLCIWLGELVYPIRLCERFSPEAFTRHCERSEAI
jgi:hypothetical protein